jgi:hypothetical protein
VSAREFHRHVRVEFVISSSENCDTSDAWRAGRILNLLYKRFSPESVTVRRQEFRTVLLVPQDDLHFGQLEQRFENFRDELAAELGSPRIESPERQIDRLGNFILAEVAGEPSANEGAVDTAIRVIRKLQTAQETRP